MNICEMPNIFKIFEVIFPNLQLNTYFIVNSLLKH